MAIQSTGAISFSDLQSEFGGTHPISASEYYLGAGAVTINNTGVPGSGRLDLSDFYGSQRALSVIYEIIGAGGTGGGGDSDGGGNGVYGASGGSSSLSANNAGLTLSITSAGGAGGLNGGISRLQNHDGQASHYGRGGYGGNNNSAGSPPPSTSYGAGGGGGGGDAPGTFDSSGNAGIGGFAAVREAGTSLLAPGTDITVVIGQNGGNNSYGYDGARGADGYARLQVGNTVNEYTSPGTYTFTVPS